MEYQSNNQANVTGEIDSEFELSHEIYSEKFYTFTLKIPRLSGAFDNVRIMASQRLLEGEDFKTGDLVEIDGQFRSYNSSKNGDNKLILTVFAKDIRHTQGIEHNPNALYLNGYICKPPVYRTTPFGREITDLLLAVNRTYNKSDYIPIIAWGRNARYCRSFEVGDNIKVWGRIQSRNYQKKLSDDEVVTKTAYEVSINRLEKGDADGGEQPDNGGGVLE